MENGKICIRLDLEGEEKDQFIAVQKDRGISFSTELVRLLIREAYKKLSVEA